MDKDILYNLDNVKAVDCSSVDGHIWTKLKENRNGDMYYGPGNGYVCKNCKTYMRTQLPIPCKHQWIKMSHNLGSNYLQTRCKCCGKETVEFNS